jgi:hypothetical protein
MTQAVQGQRLEARIAEQNFQRPTGSRIALADDREIGTDVIKHRWEKSAGGRRGLQANLLAE